jgi:hypothetical protein
MDLGKVLSLLSPFRYAIRQIQGIAMSLLWEAIQDGWGGWKSRNQRLPRSGEGYMLWLIFNSCKNKVVD